MESNQRQKDSRHDDRSHHRHHHRDHSRSPERHHSRSPERHHRHRDRSSSSSSKERQKQPGRQLVLGKGRSDSKDQQSNTLSKKIQVKSSHLLKFDKLIFFLEDADTDKDRAQLFEYYRKFMDFKYRFKKELSSFQPVPAHQDKIWGQWIIRNLNSDKKIYHPIPNPQACKDDQYIIKHMIERKCKDETIAREIYAKLVKQLAEIHSEFSDFKLSTFQSPERQLLFKDCYAHVQDSAANKGVIEEYQKKYKRCFCLDIHQFIMEKLGIYYSGKKELCLYNTFELVYSYEILDFVTKQYCLPLEVMNAFYEKFNVRSELFASPLNTFFRRYCSLFQIDKLFGSYGSFYELVEENVSITGRCQANPPHIEEEYNKSALYLDQLLESKEKKDEDLLITYFIPWHDCEGYKTIKKSKFFIDEIVLQPYQHYEYIITEGRFVDMKLNTYMITLGTQKARETYAQEKGSAILTEHIVKGFKDCKNYKGIQYVV